jgi:hypothetical protein
VVADSICVPIVNGLNDRLVMGKLKVYPNPNNGQFMIEFSAIQKDVLQLRIMDMLGREVYLNQILAGQKNVEVSVPPTPGNYFIELSNDQGDKVRKSFVVVN